MKLRGFLKKLRLRSVQAGDGQRSVDNVDALASAAGAKESLSGVDSVPAMAPPGWVPSQQDWGRPKH